MNILTFINDSVKRHELVLIIAVAMSVSAATILRFLIFQFWGLGAGVFLIEFGFQITLGLLLITVLTFLVAVYKSPKATIKNYVLLIFYLVLTFIAVQESHYFIRLIYQTVVYSHNTAEFLFSSPYQIKNVGYCLLLWISIEIYQRYRFKNNVNAFNDRVLYLSGMFLLVALSSLSLELLILSSGGFTLKTLMASQFQIVTITISIAFFMIGVWLTYSKEYGVKVDLMKRVSRSFIVVSGFYLFSALYFLLILSLINFLLDNCTTCFITRSYLFLAFGLSLDLETNICASMDLSSTMRKCRSCRQSFKIFKSRLIKNCP